MTAEELHDALCWRNLAVAWHQARPESGCGCGDETADADFCAASRDFADDQYAHRDDPALAGPADPWDHDAWVKAWGRNAPVVVGDTEFRVPKPPAGMGWLLTRLVVNRRCAIDLALLRSTTGATVTVARARVEAEPGMVAAKARRMLQQLPD